MVDGEKLTAVYGMWMILRYPVQMREKQKKMLNQLEKNMGKLRTTGGRKHTYPQNGPKYLIRERGGGGRSWWLMEKKNAYLKYSIDRFSFRSELCLF